MPLPFWSWNLTPLIEPAALALTTIAAVSVAVLKAVVPPWTVTSAVPPLLPLV